MKLVIFGLSITSSWGNGHATTYRALTQALHARGHRIVFFERNQEWYASNRDLPESVSCDIRLFEAWKEILPEVRRELRDCDVAVVGSYFPDGIQAIQELIDSDCPVKGFYDIDTPITVSGLKQGNAEYIKADQIPALDLYFSFTGGPILDELESRFGAKRAVPLYCSFDPQEYYRREVSSPFACDLSYMGTYAADRQPKVDDLLCGSARELSEMKFILAGSQYPAETEYPDNVRHIPHLAPAWHADLYSSSRLVLNLTRREMVSAGYSPSVRLFEAAACGSAIVSDRWPGLESFFVSGEEILLASNSQDVIRYLRETPDSQAAEIGARARARVMAEHTSYDRAKQFEEYVSSPGVAADSRSHHRALVEGTVLSSESSLP